MGVTIGDPVATDGEAVGDVVGATDEAMVGVAVGATAGRMDGNMVWELQLD